MAKVYSVALEELIDEFSLETLYRPEGDVFVSCKDVNRPGLPLAGFFDHFEPPRIEIIIAIIIAVAVALLVILLVPKNKNKNKK